MIETLQFESNITDIQKVNPLFSSCKVKVMYTGVNRNNSDISQEVVENAIPTIYNIPIVGEFVEKVDDFGGHGGKIEISDQGVKFIRTTMPYGVVPESAQVYWEDITEDDGVINKYLVIDGAYLWTGRFPEAQKVIEDGKGQSMEIDVVDGEFNKSKVYEIKNMVFSALCILGDGIEPCFESASITAYSLNKDEFKNEFRQMMAELNFSMESSKNVEDNIMDKGGKEMSEENKEIVTEFSLSSEQLKNELRRELAKAVTEDSWGYCYQDYYLVDYLPDQNVVIAKDWDENYLVGFSYTVDGDKVSVDLTNEQRYKIEYVPMAVEEVAEDFTFVTKEQMEYKLKVNEKETETKVTSMFEVKVAEKETALTDLQSQFDVVKQEKEDLATFKADKLRKEKESQISEVFESVSSELTEEEIAPFKEKAFEMEIEDLKKDLYALIGKKAFDAKAKFNSNKKSISMSIIDDVPSDSEIVNSYDSIILKYNK